MPVIEEMVVVQRPRQDVFDFFIDPANIALYSSNIVEYEMVSGEVDKPGRVDKGAVRVAGRRLDFTSELLEVDPGRRVVIRSTDAKIPYTLDLAFDDDGHGTRISWHQETETLAGFFGKLADAVVVKMYSHDVKSNLQKAKTLLEEA
jgi:carbon monoxide dehydrogenase subunit G